MFLRNADIKETAAVFFAEIRQTGAGFHRRRNGAQLLIYTGYRAHRLAERMRKTLGNGFPRALFAVKRRKAVVNAWSVLRVFISASFIGADVDKHRLIHIARHRQNRRQGAQVVSVERAVIIKAKILKDRGVENILFDLVFHAAHFGSHVLAHLRHAAQCGFDAVFCV